jgi:hypothetical protein
MKLSNRSRLELALALYYEHAKTHKKTVRDSAFWTFLFFAMAAWAALTRSPYRVFYVLVSLGLMIANAVIGLRDQRKAEMCLLKFREEVMEIADTEFGGPVKMDWKTGTYEPVHGP